MPFLTRQNCRSGLVVTKRLYKDGLRSASLGGVHGVLALGNKRSRIDRYLFN